MKHIINSILILGCFILNFSIAGEKALHEIYKINQPKISEDVQNQLLSNQNTKISDIKNLAAKNNIIVAPGRNDKTNSEIQRLISEPVSIGETFKNVPFSNENNIDHLTKSETKSFLNRDLFGSIDKSATYYSAKYLNSAPFVKSTFLQFVTDPAWNRVLYGNLNHWIKSMDIKSPSAIDVDSDGRVFIGSEEDSKIYVYQIEGEDENISLNQIYTIDDIIPIDISLNDNATPLNITDDYLFIVNASANQVYKYKLYQNRAEKIKTFKNFDSPTAILCGKINGVNNNLIYVIDKLAKRVRLFNDSNNELVLLKTLKGEYDNYFTSIQSDHFGNIYITDVTDRSTSKYTFDLEYLDEIKTNETTNSSHYAKIPFGKIEIEDEGVYWTGFDQMFSAQKWTEKSGISRHQLGVSLNDITYYTDENNSSITSEFTLTDAAQIDFRIYDSNDRLVRILRNDWMTAGEKLSAWDRRDDNNDFVLQGNYKIVMEATSSYTEEILSASFELNLPLYYWQDCGSDNMQDDKYLVQGEQLNWGANPTLTANAHESNVVYKFDKMNPESTYEIQAEYYSKDGMTRFQSMTANNFQIHTDVKVTDEITNTGFIEIPKGSYENGNLIISINRTGDGNAVVSQLWIRETGTDFAINFLDENIPETFQLSQNYPNPFNPTTTIEFRVPVSQNIILKIFNILGQEVETLVQEYKKAGVHKITFDGHNFASGVYFYQIKAGDFIKNKKMILIK